ncbi:hypothetical protein N9P41_02215 [Pseudomonadales bacterium]|nr:hypothetical protein [Pseudomonadales bacterium]
MKKLITTLSISLALSVAWAESGEEQNTRTSSYSCVFLTYSPVFFKYKVTTNQYGIIRGSLETAKEGVVGVQIIETPHKSTSDKAESFFFTRQDGLYFYEISLRRQPHAQPEEDDYLKVRAALMGYPAWAIDGGFSEQTGDLNYLVDGKCTLL